MQILDLFAIVLGLACLFSFINYRTLRLPSSIGLMLSGLFAAAIVAGIDHVWPGLDVGRRIRQVLEQLNFSHLLLQGMLGFLLFAGALSINLESLWKYKYSILLLAFGSTLLSTAMIGLGTYEIFHLLHAPLALRWCLVFGALISPTDPIAVLGMLTSIHVSKSLEIKVAGESLLNDGIGVVLFSVLLGAALGYNNGSPWITALSIFSRDVVGGSLLGLGLGYAVFEIIRRIDEPNLEVLFSVALVTGLEAIAFALHLSAPIACVVGGIFIGNTGRRLAMTEPTRHALDLVWSFADYAMNAVLFLFMGVEVFAIPFDVSHWLGFVMSVPLALSARFLSVTIPAFALGQRKEFPLATNLILTWGGLRGGISIALALSLPSFDGRSAILGLTYTLVAFTLIIQGLTMRPLLRRIAFKTSGDGVRRRWW